MEVCAWRCVKGGSLDLRAQLLDLLLPGALLAQQRRLHQRAHLLAHLAVHLAQRRERRGVRDVGWVVGCEVCRWGIKSAEICRLVHFFGSDLQAQILGPTGPMSKTKMRQDLLQYATVDIGMGMPYHRTGGSGSVS